MNLQDIISLRENIKYFIDCEASGLSKDSYPIEIGVSCESHKFSRLIQPFEKWDFWDANAQKIHKIKRNTLFEHGVSGKDIALRMNELYEGKVLWADSNYDNFWVSKLFIESNIKQRFIVGNIYNLDIHDAYKIAFRNLIGTDIKHRALPDATQLEESWLKLLNIIEEDLS